MTAAPDGDGRAGGDRGAAGDGGAGGDRILAASGQDEHVRARADMSDLLRRIKRPRRTPAADNAPGSPATSASPAATPETSPGAGVPAPPLAGEDLADQRPTALRRGRLRKRLRFLDRERELLLRDLGGLVYEIHRTGAPGDREHHRALVTAKVERLAHVDAELEAGLASLGQTRGDTVLREPGIGGTCPRCGEIHGSDARFCSACGSPLEVAAPRSEPGRGAAPPASGDAAVPPGPVTATADAAEQPTRIVEPRQHAAEPAGSGAGQPRREAG